MVILLTLHLSITCWYLAEKVFFIFSQTKIYRLLFVGFLVKSLLLKQNFARAEVSIFHTLVRKITILLQIQRKIICSLFKSCFFKYVLGFQRSSGDPNSLELENVHISKGPLPNFFAEYVELNLKAQENICFQTRSLKDNRLDCNYPVFIQKNHQKVYILAEYN